MKQRLIVRPNGPDHWVIIGEGLNFYVSCADKESALFIAHSCRNQWYPRARVILEELTLAALREERFQRSERTAELRSDWNE